MTVFLLSVAGGAFLLRGVVVGLVLLEGWATNSNEKQP